MFIKSLILSSALILGAEAAQPDTSALNLLVSGAGYAGLIGGIVYLSKANRSDQKEFNAKFEALLTKNIEALTEVAVLIKQLKDKDDKSETK